MKILKKIVNGKGGIITFFLSVCLPGGISAYLYIPEGRCWRACWAWARSPMESCHFESLWETWSSVPLIPTAGEVKGAIYSFLPLCPQARLTAIL